MSSEIYTVCGAVTTNDNVNLYYTKLAHVDPNARRPPLVFIHGWSGSHRYFDLNLEPLAALGFEVYAFDLRFHGASDKPAWGFHVARLAADLRDFLTELSIERATLIGTSLGAAIIWSYIELFGEGSISKVVFVDQAPSQWLMPDWNLGSKGIFDASSLANIQCAVKDLESFADGNAECCLSKPLSAKMMATLKVETLRCQPLHLAKLMADHAPIDWRPTLAKIRVPCLNIYGSDSGCFPPGGCAHVGECIPGARNLELEGCNHWLYLEEPERFNTSVAGFVCPELETL